MVFHAYIVRCADGSYYTGHTDSLDQRISQHNSGSIPGYTRNRRPVRLVWSQEFGERYEALGAERQIKGWSRAKKEALIDRRWDELSRLAQGRAQFVLRQAQDERGAENPRQPDLLLEESVIRDLRQQARAAAPNECCGMLLGNGAAITAILPAANVHSTPRNRFEIDPQSLIDAHRAAREGGPQIVGYYHSHPVGKAQPSETDAAMASGDGAVWAIVGEGGDVAFWRSDPSGFSALSYRIFGSL